MEKFDVSKLTPEFQNEIKSCKTVEELKALLASSNYDVPDSKLGAILQLCANAAELDLSELAKVTGGTGVDVPFCKAS